MTEHQQPNGATDAEDRALVARISRGDRTALELLYRRHAPWLTARLESRCADTDLVDIALQDTFLAVWKTAKKYKGSGAVGAWLWGIAIRRLIDQLRKRQATPISPDVIARFEAGASGRPTSDLGRPDRGFEDDLTAEPRFGELGPALSHLHPDLQAVLIATAIDGLTTKEAGRLLGIAQGTVKTRLMRARNELQHALAQEQPR